jgi:rRNA maturation endonuclease Nob1
VIGEERQDAASSPMLLRSDVEAHFVHVSVFTLLCVACRHKVAVRMAPERCPVCGGSVWEHASDGGAMSATSAPVA